VLRRSNAGWLDINDPVAETTTVSLTGWLARASRPTRYHVRQEAHRMTHPDITYRGTVQQWHCDFMGHMNVMWYVGKFDEATWNFAARMGLTGQYLKDTKRGMAAVEQRICYKREALVGDTLTVRTAAVEVKPKSVRFVHEMRRGDMGDLLAVMMAIGVHIDTEARKSIAFEHHILQKSHGILAPDPTLWDKWPPEQGHLT
jgi:acyl-CoA thioester hydrolase